MSSMLLDCVICNVDIEKWGGEEFHRESDGTGPYCDQCWLFAERIEKLEDMVKSLDTSRKVSEWRA